MRLVAELSVSSVDLCGLCGELFSCVAASCRLSAKVCRLHNPATDYKLPAPDCFYGAERTKRLPGFTAALPCRQSGQSSGS